MAAGRFSKQAAPFLVGRLNANNNGDSPTIGGQVSSAPAGLTASQYLQNIPGDRIILDPATATAYSNNAVGNLYTGTYRYVLTANSTSSPTLGHAAFWECNNANGAGTAAQDGLYQVTSDEDANHTVSLFTGVFINNITKTNMGWIQESGKATCKFRTSISANAAIGGGVYLAAVGNNSNAADVGAFDCGSNNAANQTYFQIAIDQALTRYVGVAEALPSNNNASLVNLVMSRASFRW
jgi:hypothetical protein